MMESTYFSWEDLITPAAASAAVLLIVQFTKAPVDKLFGKIPTRLFVLVLSLMIVLGAQAFGGDGLSWQNLPLALINSVVVGAAAMGEYEVLFAGSDNKKKQGTTEPPGGPGNPDA